MSEKKIQIDPEKFACHFMDSLIDLDPDHDLEGASKKRLAAYLSAYFLVERFNQLEEKTFASAKENLDLSHMSYTEILKKISELNKY